MLSKPLRTSIILTLLLMLFITACTSQTALPATQTTAPSLETAAAAEPPDETNPAQTETAAPTLVSPSTTPDLRLDPEDWQNWPIIPTVSARARAAYEAGLEKGTEPDRFSKVGDCQNITTYFLAAFDDPTFYILGPEYDYLQETIDHFSGSWSRESAAVAGGMNVASVLSPFWADKAICDSNESPLACELRLNRPSLVLISMEESWGSNNKVENYEKYMRQVIETVIEFGALPILATKADNIEGDYAINAANARLAYEYDLPLWNFWRAVQPLPDHGLDEGGFHLTLSRLAIPNDFTDANNMERGWPNRNLTALQVIDAVWRQLNDLPLTTPAP